MNIDTLGHGAGHPAMEDSGEAPEEPDPVWTILEQDDSALIMWASGYYTQFKLYNAFRAWRAIDGWHPSEEISIAEEEGSPSEEESIEDPEPTPVTQGDQALSTSGGGELFGERNEVRDLIFLLEHLNAVRDVSPQWMGPEWRAAMEQAVEDIIRMGSQELLIVTQVHDRLMHRQAGAIAAKEDVEKQARQLHHAKEKLEGVKEKKGMKQLLLLKHAAKNPGRVTRELADKIDFYVEWFHNIAELTKIKHLLVLMRELRFPPNLIAPYQEVNSHQEAQRRLHGMIGEIIHSGISERLWPVETRMETWTRDIGEPGVDKYGTEFLFTVGPDDELAQSGFRKNPVLVIHSLQCPSSSPEEKAAALAAMPPKQRAAALAEMSHADIVAMLPQGWERRRTLEHGLPYYVDHNTQTTQWELPKADAPLIVHQCLMSTCETGIGSSCNPSRRGTFGGRTYTDKWLCEQLAFVDELSRKVNTELGLPVGEAAVIRWEPYTQSAFPPEGGPKQGQAQVALGELVELQGYTGERTHLNGLLGRVIRSYTNTIQPDWYDVRMVTPNCDPFTGECTGVPTMGDVPDQLLQTIRSGGNISVRWDRIAKRRRQWPVLE